MAVREYAGAAKRTALASGITATDTTITLADATGYPTGATGPFAIALDLGVAAEEKVLVASRSGNTLTVASGGRGYDGTTAAAHGAGSSADHVLTAVDVREANGHVNDTTGDPHPQYLTPAEANSAYVERAAVAAVLQPAAETTSSTTYVDLATVTSVTVTVGPNGRVLLNLSAEFFANTVGVTCYVSVSVSGATSRAATDGQALVLTVPTTSTVFQASRSMVLTGLTPGSTTFSIKHRVSSGTGTFSRRELIAIPL